MVKTSVSFIVLYAFCVSVCAGVVYQEKTNILWVTDFSKTNPCTPEKLYELDRQNGWEKVEYDKSTDTCKINANLWIGNNQGTNTYFQIGDSLHPEITVMVKGNVLIKPYWEKDKNSGKNWWHRKGKRYINRLTMGSPSDDKIRPTLKIDNSEQKAYTLIIGGGKIANIHGGQLHAYNSTITAASSDPKYAIGAVAKGKAKNIFLGGYQSNILKNVTISRAAEMMSYAIFNQFGGIMNNVTFKYGNIAVSTGMTLIFDCTVTNCRKAVYDLGSMDLTMINCKLENNDSNWDLRYGGKGIVCIDCDINLSKGKDILLSYHQCKTGDIVYPRVISKRHIIIKVVDEFGKPIPQAEIKITPNITDPEVEELIFTTDKQGMTPGEKSSGAVLLAEEKIQASDEKTPVTKKFTYTIKVEIPWFNPSEIKNFRPVKSWETITITLK